MTNDATAAIARTLSGGNGGQTLTGGEAGDHGATIWAEVRQRGNDLGRANCCAHEIRAPAQPMV